MAGLAMTRQEMIDLIGWHYQTMTEEEKNILSRVEHIVEVSVLRERNACAKVCEETDLVEYQHCMVLHIDGHATLRNAAAAIRARGQQ